LFIWKNRAATSVGTAEGMKFKQPHVWRSGVLSGLALVLAACGTTYGTGTNPGAQTVKDLTGMLSLGGGGNGPPIAYEARPGIVPPPANASLPPPGSGQTVQNWPTDPDVVAREQAIANANKRADTGDALVDPGFRLPKQKVEVVNEESQTIDDDLLALTGKKEEQQTLFAKAKGGAAGQVDAEGNPVRTALTEPPADYRIPDPTAPEEFEAASKRGLFKKKVKTSPSEMGGGTDDIADPNVSIADQ
jgi:hypothetical protein